MKIADAVKQIARVLPSLTSKFSSKLSATAVALNGVVTVTTSIPTNLKSSAVIEIISQPTRTPITSISKSNTSFTITTGEDHDLTLNYQEEVSLGGFASASWNDSFQLIGVENRLNFTLRSGNSLPLLNGGEYLNEVKIGGLSGRFQITVIDENNFTIENQGLPDGNYSFEFNAGVRVAGVANYETAAAIYTQDKFADADQCWCFCYMGGAAASKDRSIDSDATANRTAADDQRTRVIETLTVVFVIPTMREISGVEAVDLARNELFFALLKSINGVKFGNGASDDFAFQLNFNSHDQQEYNRAYYAHQYTFENVYDITLGDNAVVTDTRAFRDIDETLQYNQPLSILFSLDDKQL